MEDREGLISGLEPGEEWEPGPEWLEQAYVTWRGKRIPVPRYSKLALRREPIDPEIYGLVAELNSAGLVTGTSCAGHELGGGECGIGLVEFEDKLSHREVVEARGIAKGYGLTGTYFKSEESHYPTRKVRTSMYFNPLSW